MLEGRHWRQTAMHESVVSNLRITRSFLPCKRSHGECATSFPSSLPQEFDASATERQSFLSYIISLLVLRNRWK